MILYQIDNNKKVRTWEITVIGFTICISHGLLVGTKVESTESIIQGKGSRTIDEQILSRVNSRINKQMLKGYRKSIEEAKKYQGQNELNLFKPMLAQQFNKQKTVDTNGAVLQRKLDGNRLLVTKQDGTITCYTRNGKAVKTLDHIIEQLGWLKEGQTIDGEIYRHGMALKDIRGAVAKKQASTAKLNYHIYDMVDDRPFKERFQISKYTQHELESMPSIVFEPFWEYTNRQNTEKLFNTVRQQGYEGLMMRLDNYGYDSGKRSKGLLKIKHRYDAEYEVIDIEVAKNGAGILIMRLPNGKVVKGVAPGTMLNKVDVAQSPENYIGLLCTCSFAYLTEFGIPFHLTCDSWRT